MRNTLHLTPTRVTGSEQPVERFSVTPRGLAYLAAHKTVVRSSGNHHRAKRRPKSRRAVPQLLQ